MKKVAIIPARGGSKRIPRKNIKMFCNLPIISYSIKLAVETNMFDEIVVSSDDDEILQVAKEHGASYLLKRPLDLSGDEVPTLPVISHAIESIKLNHNDLVCCIYPTAPLLEKKYVIDGFNALVANKQKAYAFSVVEFDSSPFRGFYLQDDVITLLFPQYQLFRSQDLDKVYHDAGSFYWGYARSFLEQKMIFGSDSIPIILPRMLVQDIDTLDDWNLAEIKYKLKYA
ncbi:MULTISPECIES: pseudaminic acid cytidylyltransferase [unclassified Helicobacter]|uniref:pseudaminic acid cytidylyltransferase n=1 Tax=unclassified Helicobacter TaxID=2593540 RepID=UPI000CF0D7F4|nr:MULTISPECIES: pseudaminic acid cytidylyltransferase [unclassified Helicobacter]